MKLSVIIPTLNEAAAIRETLEDLQSRHRPDEVIVADGGSQDGTVSLANGQARVLRSEKGRARQMNAGAREAAGDVFLFLHADTKLPPGGLARIREAIGRGSEAGRFRMRFDRGTPSTSLGTSPLPKRRLRWLLRFSEFYTRFHFFSYGDQGFFVRRDLFERLGGFREDVPFEDIDFYKRLRKATRPVILRDAVVTSARRFEGLGIFRQKGINLLLAALDYGGFDVKALKSKLYPEVR